MELPRRLLVVEAALEAQFAEREQANVLLEQIASTAEIKKKRSRKALYLSAVLTASVGAVAYWSKERADEAYDRYLHSANIERQDKEFAKSKRMDRLAGASFVGMEAGLVLSSYLLFFGR
jgi:hypothetical protein